jgi:arylsulfatase A-like enzyme
MQRPPNVIFMLCDDLGWGDLACHGHTLVKTPNIDRLAAQGSLFTHFYSASPVCSPSRAAFLTGQFPARVRIHDYLPVPLSPHHIRAGVAPFLDPQVPTVSRALQEVGYATGHIGKWHLGNDSDSPDVSAYGFDFCRVTHGRGCPYGEWWNDRSFRARASALFVDEAIQFVEENQDSPFYLNLWPLDPHATLNPTLEQMAPYEHLKPAGVPYPGAMAIYYAVITNLDAQIGRLLARLDELGLAENTLVIFSSDNGPEDIEIPGSSHSAVGSTGPFRGRKRSLYDGGVRMPFIARWPGVVPAGKVNDTSVIGAVDLLPTVCALAGAEPSKDGIMDGEDVSDILSGGSRQRRKPLFWDYRFGQAGPTLNWSPQLAIREGDWKLMMNRDGSRVELYNLAVSRMETDNFASHHPQVIARLSEKLLSWARTLPPGEPTPESGHNDYPWPE